MGHLVSMFIIFIVLLYFQFEYVIGPQTGTMSSGYNINLIAREHSNRYYQRVKMHMGIHVLIDSIFWKCLKELLVYWKETNMVFLFSQESEPIAMYIQHYYSKSQIVTYVTNVKTVNISYFYSLQSTPVIVVTYDDFITNNFFQLVKLNGFLGASMSVVVIDMKQSFKTDMLPADFKTVSCQITILIPTNNLDNSGIDYSIPHINIYDIFWNQKEIVKIRLVTWNTLNGFIYTNICHFLPKDMLQGRLINIGAIQYDPYILVEDFNGNKVASGFLKDIFDIIEKLLNFRMKIINAEMNILGSRNTTGLLKMIKDRQVNIGVGPFMMAMSRWEVFHIPHAILIAKMGIWIKQPDRTTASPVSYIQAFNNDLWIVIGCSTILVFAVIAIVLRLSPVCNSDSSNKVNYVKPESHIATMHWIISGFFLDEVIKETRGISSKLVFGSFLIATTIIFFHYISVFRSFVINQTEERVVQNFHDVILRTDYHVGCVGQTGMADTFLTANDGIYNKLRDRILEYPDNLVQNVSEGLQKVVEENFIFLFDVHSTSHYARKYDFRVKYIPTKHATQYVSVGIRRDFPYKMIISDIILLLKEVGIISRLMRKYFPSSNFHQGSGQFTATTCVFDLNRVMLPFLVLGCGHLLSLTILIFEIFYRNTCQHYIM